MTPAQLIAYLEQAKKLVQDPTQWTRHVMARTSEGTPCNPKDADATCFCISGAVWKVTAGEGRDIDHSVVMRALNNHTCDVSKYTFHSVTEFNDYSKTDHAQVMRLFDQTLARERHRHGLEQA